MNIHAIEQKIKEINERVKYIKNPFKYMKTVLDNESPKRFKWLKKTLLYILIIFIAINAFLYYTQYKRNVINAPQELKTARLYMTNATMFSFYYTLFIKLGLDFQNPILAPFQISQDYFYEKGLQYFPKDDAESALWFEMFKVKPYVHSMKGDLGNMASLYGKEYAQDMINQIFHNIELLSTQWLVDYQNNKDLQRYTIKQYISLMTVYVNEFHLSSEGGLLNRKNYMNAHTNKIGMKS